MLFGSSGIRRPFDASLVKTALDVGFALGENYENILIGQDTQPSSDAIAHAVISGVLASGGNIFSTGIAPTPTVAFSARNFDIGIMITASHNGGKYGGIKLFNQDGSSFIKKQQYQIEHQIKNQFKCIPNGSLGHYDAIDTHIREIVFDAKNTTNMTRALIDSGNGSGKFITPFALEEIGIGGDSINCIRESEPSEEHTRYIPDIMRRDRHNLAILHDEDADRMMAYDNKFRYISGDHLMMLFIMYLDVKHLVTTYDTTMAVNDMAEVRRTPVGDSYVSEELIHGGDFGGEPSGAWIFPKHSLCPDGCYAAAKLCEISNEWDIAEIIDSFPKYTTVRKSFACKSSHEIVQNMGVDIATDGYRFENNQGWYLIRASGTEPKLRITAEGKTTSDAKELMRKGVDKISLSR